MAKRPEAGFKVAAFEKRPLKDFIMLKDLVNSYKNL